MAELLYLDDCYLRTCVSKVLFIRDGRFIELDRTVFYPRGGGQPNDIGVLRRGNEQFQIVSVAKSNGAVFHEIPNGGLQVGDTVECEIDWVRRYKMMRMHTAGHVLSAIMFQKSGILITGNQIDADKTRFDFSMENFDKEAFQTLVEDANAAIGRNLPVSISYLKRDEAMRLPGVVKLASALPPDVQELRMVKIGDVDFQADGGTHVKNTSEVGKIVFLGAENKGKSNRRIYYSLEP